MDELNRGDSALEVHWEPGMLGWFAKCRICGGHGLSVEESRIHEPLISPSIPNKTPRSHGSHASL